MATSERFCKDCGANITDTQTVYSTRCSDCQEKMRYKRGKTFLSKKQEKRKRSAPRCLTELGTSDFKGHRKKNFKEEAEVVKEEMKKLGLRK